MDDCPPHGIPRPAGAKFPTGRYGRPVGAAPTSPPASGRLERLVDRILFGRYPMEVKQ